MDYKVSLKNSETKLKQLDMKSKAVVRDFKRIEQEGKVLCAEKVLLNFFKRQANSNASAERQGG